MGGGFKIFVGMLLVIGGVGDFKYYRKFEEMKKIYEVCMYVKLDG